MRAFGLFCPQAVREKGWNLVRIAVAVVLLTAAVLKTHQLATEPIIGTSILDARWLLMATVEFELFFGLWLLANVMPRATWMAALGCFAAFAYVSLYKALSGHASCDCFGRVPVNPWITTGLDLAIVASLLKWRPHRLPSPACGRGAGGEGHLPWSLLPKEAVHRATVVLVSWLLVGLPAAYAMGSYADTTLSDAGQIIGNGKIVVLEPEKWVGKRFPLLDYIDIGDRLRSGKWICVFYHLNCADCQIAMPNYLQTARVLASKPAAPHVLFVEMPPYVYEKVEHGSEEPLFVARLSNKYEWFVKTPVELAITDGIVTFALEGGEGLSWIEAHNDNGAF